MSSKQEASYFSKDASCESTNDDSSHHRGDSAFSADAVNQLTLSPMDSGNQKRRRSSSVKDDASTKKRRSDSYITLEKKDFHSRKTLDTDHGEFDLCTPEGQIAAARLKNPKKENPMTWEQAKHAARREYNRVNAARARQRHKEEAETRDHQIAELKSQVEQLTRLNDVLMNYIYELHGGSSNIIQPVATSAQPGAPSGASSHQASIEATARGAKTAKSNGNPPTETEAAIMTLLKQRQRAEGGLPQSSSLTWNQQTHQLRDVSRMHNEKVDVLNNILRGPDLTGQGSTSASIGRIVQTLQAQQLLAERTMNNNLSLPWSLTSGISQTGPNLPTNSLWDVLMSVQHLNSILPSSPQPPSGAPK